MRNNNIYTIRTGDTFRSLESRWNIPQGTLQKLNPTLNPGKLKVGDKIKTPIIYIVVEKQPRRRYPHYIDQGVFEQPIDKLRVHQSFGFASKIGNVIPNGKLIKGYSSMDLGGLLRDLSSKVNYISTISDGWTTLIKKASFFGKYSNSLAIGTAGLSVLGDYGSNSDSSSFLNNTTQTIIETSVGLESPVVALAINTILEDSKNSDGLTNLNNGRLSNAYSLSQRQTQNYIRQNFYNKKATSNTNEDFTYHFWKAPYILIKYWKSDEFLNQFR